MSFFNGAKAKRWRITPFWTLTLFFLFFLGFLLLLSECLVIKLMVFSQPYFNFSHEHMPAK